MAGAPWQAQKDLTSNFHLSILSCSGGLDFSWICLLKWQGEKQVTMLSTEPRVFTPAGSRMVRNLSWDWQAPLKGVSEQEHNPHPQLSSWGFRTNAEGKGCKQSLLPLGWQEDISALLLTCETVPWTFSPPEAQQWTPWAQFLLPLDFPCGLPQPLA